MSENKPLVLYHAGCDDGFGAAWAVWRKHPDWEFVPATYGAPLPNVAGREVYMVDFSVKAADLRAMAMDATAITIIDHHASAVRELGGPLHQVIGGGCPVTRVLDLEHSGAVLAWEFFHTGVPVPELLRYIEDRDLWRKGLSDLDEVTFALRSYPQDFDLWSGLAARPMWELAEEGRPILRYFRRQVQSQVERWRHAPTFAEIGGHRVPCINSVAQFTSELGEALCAEGQPSGNSGQLEAPPFAAVFWHTRRGVTYSLRSRPPHGIDVARVAEGFGGGGHAAAAGFSVAWPFPLLRPARESRA